MLLALGAYWNSVNGGFHFDDQGILLDPYIVSSGSGWQILRVMQTRPLTFLTFHWNYLANGTNPRAFHLVNVALHAANAVLVMLLARRTVRGSFAWLAGAFFAVHPLQTQAVNYIFERATLLATFFALLSLLCFVKEKYSWAIVFFGLSLLAKEETIALPLFMLVYDLARKRSRLVWWFYACMSGVALLAAGRLLYVLYLTPDAQLGFHTKGISSLSYAITQCRVIARYVKLILAPAGLNLDHHIELSHGLTSPPGTLVALLLLGLIAGTLVSLAWRGNETALWGLGFFVLLLPSSSIVPAADLMFEHRTYLPMVCAMIAAARLLARIRHPLLPAGLALLILTLTAATIVRNRVWHDDRSLWADIVAKSPRKARGYFQLGQSYAESDPLRARQLYERGLAIDPENGAAQTNLGLIFLSQGDVENALRRFHQALATGADKGLVWNNIGSAELRRGQIDDGIKAFRLALESDPCRFDARWNLIHTLSSLGLRRDAVTAGTIPAGCRYLPEQAQRLGDEIALIQ